MPRMAPQTVVAPIARPRPIVSRSRSIGVDGALGAVAADAGANGGGPTQGGDGALTRALGGGADASVDDDHADDQNGVEDAAGGDGDRRAGHQQAGRRVYDLIEHGLQQ